MTSFQNGQTFDDPRTRETIETVGLRMKAAYDEYVARFSNDSIGIVIHGDPLRALYYCLRHPQGEYPAYPELVRLLSLDTAQGLRLTRTSSDLLEADVAYVSAEAEAGLARLTTAGILAAPESRVLRDALDRFWSAVPTAPRVLCHGDLTLGNALWHAGQVVSLADRRGGYLAPLTPV
jgi:hypothetical protein